MAQQGAPNEQADERRREACPLRPSADPLDSGLRRKFLNFCEEHPWADECRIYEV